MIDGRTTPHQVLEHLRSAALKLRKKGVAPDKIADSFGVRIGTVYNWSYKAKKFGGDALRARRGAGAPPALTPEQFEEILECIQQPAGEFGYSTDLWTGARLRHFVRIRFGINYHSKYMPRFLRRIGLRLVFPERRALEQDPESVRRWKVTELPRIEEEAASRRALLFYADETSISLIPAIGRAWSFPGVRPVARVTGRRGKRVNVTGAVNRAGRLYFEMLPLGENFTAKTFIHFLRKMRVHFPRRNLTFIVDGASSHKAKEVKSYQAGQRWLRLEYLPAYSPEWNPSEEAWGHLKGCGRNGSQSSDIPSLRRETRGILRRLQKKPSKVKSFFNKLDKLKHE